MDVGRTEQVSGQKDVSFNWLDFNRGHIWPR